jgi:ATP-dependent Clp protease ATP-binding subunit ClpA
VPDINQPCTQAAVCQEVEDALRTYRKAPGEAVLFCPAILGRFNRFIVFEPLELQHVRQIVQLEFNKYADRVFDQHRVVLQLDDDALDLLAEDRCAVETGGELRLQVTGGDIDISWPPRSGMGS